MSEPARDQYDYFGMGSAPAAPVRRTVVRSHLRTVKGEPTPRGTERRDAALDAHELDRVKKLAIDHVRRALVSLYAQRDGDPIHWPVPYINADDVAHVLAKWAERPKLLDTIEGHWKGAIFRKGFVPTGHSHPSVRPHMNGTRLPAWRVR